jgi:ATP-dependent Clp protease ATP-binding subunit ClpC
MFERYTEKARRVIFFARYEALQYGSQTIAPNIFFWG